MAQNTNTAKVVSESPAEMLARVLRENAELQKLVSAMAEREAAKAGEFSLDVTRYRAPGTKGKDDKGAKGGTLAIGLGKQHIYPSLAMVNAILDRADEIRDFIKAHAAELTR